MNNIEKDLPRMRYDYDNLFSGDVMQNVKRVSLSHFPNFKWMTFSIAASLLICGAVIYLQDGTLSYEAILGLESINNETLTELEYYY